MTLSTGTSARETAPVTNATTTAIVTGSPRPRRSALAPRHSRVLLIVMVIYAIYTLLPLVWLLFSSTKTQAGLFSSFGLWFSGDFSFFDNLVKTLTYQDGIFVRWLGNTLLYVVVGAGGATLLATLDEGSQKWTSNWNRLVEEELVAPYGSWSDEWFQGLGSGRLATLVIGAWMPVNLESGSPDASGDWRVAPMPTYDGKPESRKRWWRPGRNQAERQPRACGRVLAVAEQQRRERRHVPRAGRIPLDNRAPD